MSTPIVKKGSEPIASLWPGQSQELLKELHILTREGALNSDSRRKLKQVLHLFQLIKPVLETLEGSDRKPIRIVDVGAGKNYLGFILYDLWFRERPGSRVLSIESRPELVATSVELAKRSGFDRMDFACARIGDAMASDEYRNIDLVAALHCCDTGTDDAILLGLKNEARAFALVPCCQAELARKLKEAKGQAGDVRQLWAHPIHAREFGSHLTNVIRSLVLESFGYKVRVTELVGWEHSMKNELIIAERRHPDYPAAKERLKGLLATIPVDSYLITRVRELFPSHGI